MSTSFGGNLGKKNFLRMSLNRWTNWTWTRVETCGGTSCSSCSCLKLVSSSGRWMGFEQVTLTSHVGFELETSSDPFAPHATPYEEPL